MRGFLSQSARLHTPLVGAEAPDLSAGLCGPGETRASLAQGLAGEQAREVLGDACPLKSNWTWTAFRQKASFRSGGEKPLGACVRAPLALPSVLVNFHLEHLGAMFRQSGVTPPDPSGDF